MKNKRPIILSDIRALPIDSKSQLEEFGTRFFYAAATLPPSTVEGILELLEACSESDDNPRIENLGGLKLQ